MAFNAFRPSESLFPTETIRPMESLDDGGIVINWLAEDHGPSNPTRICRRSCDRWRA